MKSISLFHFTPTHTFTLARLSIFLYLVMLCVDVSASVCIPTYIVTILFHYQESEAPNFP